MTHNSARALPANHSIELSERFVRSMLPLSILDLDGVQLFVNDALCQLLSHPPEALIGTSIADLCHAPSDVGVVEAVLLAARAGEPGGLVTYEVLVMPDRVLTVELTWTLMTRTAGEPWYLTAAFHDETARIGAVRASQRAADTFRARFDQSSLPQAMLDLEGRLTAVNSAFCTLVGRSPGDLRGHPVRDISRPLADQLGAVLAARQESTRFEHDIAGPGTTQVAVEIDVTVLRDESGQPFGAAMFVHDLTAVREQDRQRLEQTAYFASLARLAGDVAIVGDSDGKLLYVSPAAERVLGYTQERLTGARGWDFVHPDDLALADEAYATVIVEGGSRTFRYRLRTGDGAWRWVEQTSTNLLHEPIGGVVCNLRDVTDQVEADRALRESEVRFRTIAETANEGIWAMTADGQTLYANARIAAILGTTLEEVYRKQAAAMLEPADLGHVAERLANRAVRGAEHYEIGFTHPSGEHRRLLIAASPLPGPHGSPIGSLAMVSDVTEARQVEQELRRAALHDALTGLPNRALLLDRLERALLRARGRTAVVFVDLDHFKLVNDSRGGHATGDDLLRVVGKRLTASIRAHDTVARFGGDEFVVLAEDLDEGTAQELAQHLLDALAPPVTLNGSDFHIGASAGVALSPPSSAADLLRYADTAMYAAKAAGRGRVRCYDPALAEEAEQRYVLGGRLRRALQDDVLTMSYQPIVELRTGKVLGSEGLARWHDVEFGEVTPNRFVGIAEITGLAPILDRWAVGRALSDARMLRRAGAIPLDAYVSVNLTTNNLTDRGLEELIVTTTISSGLAPANVMLEITEGAVLREADLAIALLRRLRARGFLLALDDFGTGHSSLAYLRDLPISVLKIDRSFVAGIREDSDALAIVASIVDLGRAVGVTVIAKGVESEEQARLLRELGCQAAQGWLWCQALPPADVLGGQTSFTGYDTRLPSEAGRPRRRTARTEVGTEHGLDRLLSMHRKGASLATIAASLNLDGYLTPKGLRWHQTSVARAVSDDAYPHLLTAPPT